MNIRRIISRTIKEPAGDRQNIIEEAYQEDPIATMRVLQMHVYAPITRLDRWLAIEAIGGLAGKYAPESDELFRNVIRRFIWQMCEESANVPWASAEVIGSILANDSQRQYEEFVGPLYYHAGLNEICYPGLFWAYVQMTPRYAREMEEFLPKTLPYISYHDPEARAYAAWAFREVPYGAAEGELKKLLDDERVVPIFENGALKEYVIKSLAEEALSSLAKKS